MAESKSKSLLSSGGDASLIFSPPSIVKEASFDGTNTPDVKDKKEQQSKQQPPATKTGDGRVTKKSNKQKVTNKKVSKAIIFDSSSSSVGPRPENIGPLGQQYGWRDVAYGQTKDQKLVQAAARHWIGISDSD